MQVHNFTLERWTTCILSLASHVLLAFSHSNNVSGWTIQLGITRRTSHSYLGRKVKVKRVITHPHYNVGVAHDNDVALFQVSAARMKNAGHKSDVEYVRFYIPQLASKVEFHDHLKPVCLPKENEEIEPYTPCTVIGWGKKNNTES